MKKFITLFALFAIVLGVNAQNVFNVGEKRGDLNIGVGIINYHDRTRATFDQHVNFEWGVAKLGEKVTLGVGFALNNTYGGQFDAVLAGDYDYKYIKTTTTGNVTKAETITRKGTGTADADIVRDDINLMGTVSFHYSPLKNLDTYVKVGVGIGCLSYSINDVCNREGFSYENVNKLSGNTLTKYRYNDLEHANWYGYDPKVVGSVAAYIGATYFIDDVWGIDAQIGLLSSNLCNKAKHSNAFGLFALGVAYKF